MFVFGWYLPSVTGLRHAPMDKPQNDVSPKLKKTHFVEDDKTIVGNPFTIIPIGSMGLVILVYSPTTVILLTGAFVCQRQNTPRSPNGSELYSCLVPGADPVLASGSRDPCCAGNILVESSSPQPQDTGAKQLTHLRFGLKSVGILLVKPSRYTTIHV